MRTRSNASPLCRSMCRQFDRPLSSIGRGATSHVALGPPSPMRSSNWHPIRWPFRAGCATQRSTFCQSGSSPARKRRFARSRSPAVPMPRESRRLQSVSSSDRHRPAPRNRGQHTALGETELGPHSNPIATNRQSKIGPANHEVTLQYGQGEVCRRISMGRVHVYTHSIDRHARPMIHGLH